MENSWEQEKEVRESWFLIKEEELADFLHRAREEDIDLLMLEILANCEDETFIDEENDDEEENLYVHLNIEDDDDDY